VARLAEDRAGQLADHDVSDEIVRRLREEARSRSDFAKVHACAPSGDVPDDREARLVILGPEHAHTAKDQRSAARQDAAAVLESRGSSPRNYKNALVFLAADATRLRELQQAVRQHLAWSSIWDDREKLNLDPFQTKQADTKRKGADETVKARIPETYQWLIVPGQPDPKGLVEWTETRLQGQDSLAARAAKKLRNEELLLTQMGGARLRLELDRVPLWRGNHVGLKQLAEDVARYLYLPRLRDEDVLLEAVRDGVTRLSWREDTFAYADAWDEAKGRYKGLQAGKAIRALIDGQSVLVQSDVAAQQLDAEARQQEQAGAGPGGGTVGQGREDDDDGQGSRGDGRGVIEPPQQKLGRFHGSVQLDPLRLGRDAGRIAEEVVQHLTGSLGAQVRITLEIEAQLPDGAPEKLVRDVTENCRTLKFADYGFEEA
jgi:hypothetical protein